MSYAGMPEWLHEGFDPATSRVPELRSILLQANVEYNPSASKQVLVATFNSKVTPKLKTLRKAYAHIEPSSHGVQDGGDMISGPSTDSEDDLPKKATPARSKRVSDKPIPSSSAVKGRLSAAKPRTSVGQKRRERTESSESDSSESEADAKGKKAKRRKRKTKSSEIEDSDRSRSVSTPADEFRRRSMQREMVNSPSFSDYNPFQSGLEDTPDNTSLIKVKRKSTRMSEGPLIRKAVSPAIKVHEPSSSPQADDTFIELDDSFTAASPVEEPVLREEPVRRSTPNFRNFPARVSDSAPPPPPMRDLTQSVSVSPLPLVRAPQPPSSLPKRALPVTSEARGLVRPRSSSNLAKNKNRIALGRSSGSAGGRLAQMATSALLVGLAYLVVATSREKIALGYCDTGSNGNVLTRTGGSDNLPAPLLAVLDAAGLAPGCTSCPGHGKCSDASFLGCDEDYMARPHALQGISPVQLKPSCRPDTAKELAVAIVAARSMQVLKRRKGEVLCTAEGSRRVAEGKKKGMSEAWLFGMEEAALKSQLPNEELAKSASHGYSHSQLVARALADLLQLGEIQRDATYIASVAASMSLSCRAQLYVEEQALRFRKELSLILVGLLSLLYLRHKFLSSKAERAKVKELVQTALHELRSQERAHYSDPVLAPSPHVAPSQLRDLILQQVHSPSRRRALWAKVEKVVEGNSNVRVKEAEVNGEDIRVWQWVGSSVSDKNTIKGEESALYPVLKSSPAQKA